VNDADAAVVGTYWLMLIAVLGVLLRNARATWNRMLAEPQLLAITATLFTVAMSVALAGGRMLESWNGSIEDIGRVSYVMLMLTPLLGIAAALSLFLFQLRRWHLDMLGAIRKRIHDDHVSQEVRFKALCASSHRIDAYLDQSFCRLVLDDKCDLLDGFKRNDINQIKIHLTPEDYASLFYSNEETERPPMRRAEEFLNLQRTEIRFLSHAPPLPGLFFLDDGGNTRHALLVARHSGDQKLGSWIEFGDRDLAGKIREAYCASYNANLPIDQVASLDWIVATANENAMRHHSRWETLSSRFAVVSRSQPSVRLRLWKLASGDFTAILGIDQTDLISWNTDPHLLNYLKQHEGKFVRRMFVLESEAQLEQKVRLPTSAPGEVIEISTGELMARVIEKHRDIGRRNRQTDIEVGVVFKNNSSRVNVKNLDMAIFLNPERQTLDDTLLRRLARDDLQLPPIEGVLFTDKAIGVDAGAAEVGLFQSRWPEIRQAVELFAQLWDTEDFADIDSGDDDPKSPKEIADLIERKYLR